MASYTTNLNLKKPAGSENVAIGDINNNMDTIDQAFGTLNSNTVKYWKIENQTTDANGDIGITVLTNSLGNQLLSRNVLSVFAYNSETETICSSLSNYAGWAYLHIYNGDTPGGTRYANKTVNIVIAYNK